MLAETPLWCDVYDASWNRIGDGPVPLTSVNVSRNFDGAGSFSFEAPANDTRVIALLKDQRRVKFFYNDPQTNTVRQIGSGIIEKRGRKYAANGNQKSFSGPDVLSELVNYIALPNTIFTNESVSDVASTLAARAGWQAETETGLANLISARYDGASILTCLRTMTEKVGLHLREKVDVPSDLDHVIEIGRFRTDSGLYIQNGEAFTSAVFDNTEVAFIDSLTITHESSEIVNWIIAIGSGEGESALTLEKATRTSTYERETIVNNGKTLYFKKNQVSINKYGMKQKMLTVKDVVPVGNSETVIGYAADVLDEAADAFLERSGEPQMVYNLSIKKGSKLIRPGDVVHLSFRGAVRDLDGQEIEDETVEGDFFVLKVTESIGASGVTISLEISNVDKLPESMESYILSAIEDVQIRDTKPALINFRESTSGERSIQNSIVNDYVHHGVFLLPIDETVTDVTSVFLRFWSLPLYCLSVNDQAGSRYSQFIMVQGGLYPQDISLYINGVNVTSEFGPGGSFWNPNPNNTAVDGVLLDITDHIRFASGGLHQTHEIEFRCGIYSRDTAIPGYGFSFTHGSGNNGVIRATLTVQGTSQSIKSS